MTDAYDVMGAAARAEAMARLARCGRRIFKAVAIAAMWNPNPQQARLRLLGELSAPQALDSLEPGLHWGLAAGMVCCELRARIDRRMLAVEEVTGDPSAVERLAQEMDGLLEESGFHRQYRLRSMDDYWFDPMPAYLSTIVSSMRDRRAAMRA